MKPLFNSVGSNYSFSDVLTTVFSLLGGSLASSEHEVTAQLQKWFAAEPYYFYKGRDAIEFALRAAKIGEGDVVISQAFSCYAIEEAVLRVGARVEYADIDEHSCNLTAATVARAIERCDKSEKVRAVLCQHVLGIPAQSTKLREYCTKHSLLFIEDLAQGFGGVDEKGIAVGTTADVIILSFGRDKIIDAVSGGACLVPATSPLAKQAAVEYAAISGLSAPLFSIVREMLYPLFTWLIRNSWGIGVGKVALKFLQLSKLFTSPVVSDTTVATPLPKQYFPLLLSQVRTVAERVTQRQLKMAAYFECLEKEGYKHQFTKQLLVCGSGLRFPLLTSNPTTLTSKLKKAGMYFSDRWYRAPVDCGSFSCHTSYVRGQCPVAERMAESMYNLPTHQYITNDDIAYICKQVVKNI